MSHHRTTCRAAIGIVAAAFFATFLVAPATADELEPDPDAQLLLLMDASGSMADPDASGSAKIDAARSATTAVIEGLGEDQRVGLRAFSSTVGEQDTEAACTDSQMIVPIGTGNRDDLGTAVDGYQPVGGETPIGYALQEGGQDLGSEGARSILLVSDGLDTCAPPDPCEVAADLAADGIDLAIHVVGFDVDQRAREQLQCIAEAGNGSYYDADDAESLTAAMDRLATRAFRPFSVAGTPVEGTPTQDGAPEIAPGGQYTDTVGPKEEAKHYLVPRSMAGSSIHVGLSAIPRLDQKGQINLRVDSLDGDNCASDYAETSSLGNDAAWQLVTAQATAWPDNNLDDNPCRDDEMLVVSVEMTDWQSEISDTPYELVVREEPAVANGSSLPEPAGGAAWQEMETGQDGGEVVGGTSFNDAPRLEPHTSYDTHLLPGETVFFRVPVEFGQQLQAQADFPEPGPTLSEALDSSPKLVKMSAISPMRGEVTEVLLDGSEDDYNAIIWGDRPTRLTVASTQVRWTNRSDSTASQHASIDGDYYVSVAMDKDGASSYVVPFTLSVGAVGTAGEGAPEYEEVPLEDTAAEPTDDEAAQTQAPTAPEDGATSTDDQDTSTEDGAASTEDGAASTEDGAASTEDEDTPTEDEDSSAEDEDSSAEDEASAATVDVDDDGGVSPELIVVIAVSGMGLLGAGAMGLHRWFRS